MKTLRFHSIDTWFFKQSRSIQPSSEAQSKFPPSMQTLSGALRGLIGDLNSVNWHDYHSDKNHSLRRIIGYRDKLDPLSFRGPWLNYREERLYPIPLCLARRDNDIFRMIPGNPLYCDLGQAVQLLELPAGAAGAKPLESAWITRAGMQALLDGGVPSVDTIYDPEQDDFPLFTDEPRLGIARNNATRTARKGMLYQTRHVRPSEDLSIEIEVAGLSVELPSKSTIRLGGEGRPAVITQSKSPTSHLELPSKIKYNEFNLILMTPLHYQATSDSPLPGFHKEERESLTVWVGAIAGINLEIHSASVGRIQREGGWDLASKKPKPVESFIPAGSTYYFRLQNFNEIEKIHSLQEVQLGKHTNLGFGQIAIGLWNKENT